MLSKCANPACGTPFQYLREGRLFKFELGWPGAATPHLVRDKKPARKVEHYWLCGRCAATMTLALERQQNVIVVPLKHTQTRRAAAS
jgi:hypothetical protein